MRSKEKNTSGEAALLHRRPKTVVRAALGGASLIALAAAAGPALAQAATDGGAPQDVSEVVVTATRVVRDGFEAPTPTTVLGAAEIQAKSPANLADFVNTLPQLTPSVSPATTIVGVGGGTGGANFLNLRNLGVNRTLVLLNGNRVVNSSIAGGVDVNLLPQGLVKRVDVVTGGASSAWGSDAVAGVINFVLDTEFKGFKGEVQAGEAFEGDAKTYKIEAAYGGAFAGGRGHVLLEGAYTHQGGIDHYADRSWYKPWKILPNPAYRAGNGQPQNIVTQGDFLLATPGGIILSGANAFTAFDASGNPFAFNTGTPNGLYKIGGTPNDISAGYPLLVPLNYGNAFARVSYEITDDVTGYLELAYAESKTRNTTASYPALGSIVIRPDNAYLPASLRGQTFAIGKVFESLGPPEPQNKRDTFRGVLGFDGKFGGGWTWKAYYQYGLSEIDNAVYNDPIVSRVALAVDAVAGPNGTIVCRSALTAANGCSPLNPFGTAAANQAAIAYVNGVSIQELTLHQNVVAASVQGELFTLPAGPVSLAAGAEYRSEQYVANADPLSITSSYWVGNYKPGRGKYHVSEVFADAVVPIVKDAPFAKALDVEAAVRETDYSTSGRVTTWKLGGSWTVNDDLRFRATRSRDIRAPNLNDLFLGGQTNTVVLTDPTRGGASVSAVQVIQGNTGLNPEVAKTTSFGAIYRPSWFEGFSFSVDYYRINIAGGITNLNAQQIVNNCAAGQSGFCAAVLRDATGVITRVNVSGFNANSEKAEGIDYEFGYTSELSRFGGDLPGRVTIRALGTNTLKRTITALGGTTDLLNELSPIFNGPPEWRWTASLTYDLGPSRTTLTGHFISKGVYDNTYGLPTQASNLNTINTNTIKSSTTFDLSESYKFEVAGRNLEAFAVIENLFDKDPPVAAVNSFLYPGTNPTYYDTIGRRFRVGARFSF
jgi:outer membrane receptor protein involved in Fe transport